MVEEDDWGLALLNQAPFPRLCVHYNIVIHHQAHAPITTRDESEIWPEYLLQHCHFFGKNNVGIIIISIKMSCIDSDTLSCILGMRARRWVNVTFQQNKVAMTTRAMLETTRAMLETTSEIEVTTVDAPHIRVGASKSRLNSLSVWSSSVE